MPVDCPDRRWYAIRTEPRFEKIIRDQLAVRGVETLLPLRRCTSQWKSRTKLIEVALFAGYCFACFSPTQQPLVLQTPGVLEILRNQDVPEPIIAEQMAGMQRLFQSSIHYEGHLDPEQGAPVEIAGWDPREVCEAWRSELGCYSHQLDWKGSSGSNGVQ